jgi:hypothetical protein
MGMRDEQRITADGALLTRYREVTEDVRAAYLAVLGIEENSFGAHEGDRPRGARV